MALLKFRITLIVLLLLSLSSVSHAAILLDRVVAVVNREVITWSELYKMMEFETMEQVKGLGKEERMRIFKDNEAAFLERLIDIRLQVQEAKRLGLGVTPEEVMEVIENIKKKYSMTHTDFIESLQKEGLNLDEYKKRLSEQIMISKVVSRQVRGKIVVSDDDIKKQIETNREIYSGEEAYKLRQIFFKRPESGMDKKIVEDKASMIIQRLKRGEDFSALAREYSEDPRGKKSGGEIGLIKKSRLAEEFIDVVSTMRVGDFSMPFWTEGGLHIIKLDGKVSEQNIDEIREDVRRRLTEERFSERYKDWIKGLREKAYIEIKL